MTNPSFDVEEFETIFGLKKIIYDAHKDHRGDIYSSYHDDLVEELNVKFNHDKFSRSKKDVIRAFHGDEKSIKLVTCVYGRVQQVFVDYRPGSPTFLKSISVYNSCDDYVSYLIPPGVLNGYAVLSEIAVYHYKYSYNGKYNSVEKQITVKWNDKRINNRWDVKSPILSERDK